MINIQHEIEALQKDYATKLQEIQLSQQWHLLPALNEELQKNIVRITGQLTQTSGLSLIPGKSKYYRHSDCSVDLDAVVYDGDRNYFDEFLENPGFHSEVIHPSAQAPNSKKHLLKSSMRLSRGMAPKVFNSIDRCIDKLGLTSKIDIYCAQNPAMNAFCYPPHDGSIYILLTSALLEKLSEDELTFVIGHEIGHFLYQHHLLSAMSSGLGASQLSPADTIKLFSWQRNGELTADRIGLICCGSYEAACTANFKLSSGVTTEDLCFNLQDYVNQYIDIETEMKTGDGNPEDFYLTHPISPMRVMALDLFYRSETYCKHFATHLQAELTEQEMETKIAGFMKLMEPSYLWDKSEISMKIKEFIFLASMAVSCADGEMEEAELKIISQILPEDQHLEVMEKIKGWSNEMMLNAVAEQAEKILPHLNYATMCNIVRDLVLLSVADGEFEGSEHQVLEKICQALTVYPTFIDDVLNSINYQRTAA